MDGSSEEEEEEEEDVTESSQLNEEKVISALMKKLTKEQQINMLINMEQDFLTVGCLTVDSIPIPTDSTPMDSLNLSHVTVQSISN